MNPSKTAEATSRDLDLLRKQFRRLILASEAKRRAAQLAARLEMQRVGR